MKKTFIISLFVILLITLFQNFCYATNDGDVYVSAVNSNATLANWYPRHGMDGSTNSGNDWTYANDTCAFWIVPVGFSPSGTSGIFAAKFRIHSADLTTASLKGVYVGNLFGANYIYYSNPLSDGWEVNISSNNLSNVAGSEGQYLAMVSFNILKPKAGGTTILIDNIDFRHYANSGFTSLSVTPHNGAVKFFLGDFVNLSTQNIGDGAIDASDLTPFSAVYWSTVSAGNLKFNIGPTNDGTYYSMPNDPLNHIDFEDLVIFAIGYGKTGSGGLYVIPPMTNSPLEFSLGTFNSSTDEIRVPVNISGNVTDVRGFSLSANLSNMEFVRVEKQGALTGQTSLLFGKAEGNTVFVDASVFDGVGIGTSGTIANIVFKPTGPKPTISLSTVKARNTNNESFTVKIGGNSNSELPTSFGLNQNYPNPFNPTTMINYQIPKSAKVTLNIYDISGKLVTTLINGVQDAGKYSVEWKAGNNASGVYFYRINAGGFTDVKKMILEK